jgi:hypothetical protein
MKSSATRVPATQPKIVTRQRRYYLRREAAKNHQTFEACAECGAPIKPSATRRFCPGGRCRKAAVARVGVVHVCRLDATAKRLSAEILAVSR